MYKQNCKDTKPENDRQKMKIQWGLEYLTLELWTVKGKVLYQGSGPPRCITLHQPTINNTSVTKGWSTGFLLCKKFIAYFYTTPTPAQIDNDS